MRRGGFRMFHPFENDFQRGGLFIGRRKRFGPEQLRSRERVAFDGTVLRRDQIQFHKLFQHGF